MLSLNRCAGVALVLTVIALPSLGAQATGSIQVRVTEASTGRPLADAQALVDGTRIGGTTGATGEVVLGAVPPGPRNVTVRRIGYQPTSSAVTVVAGATASIEIALRISAVNLSEVVVTGLGTPTERRKVGTSIATVDSGVIAAAQATTVDQALQGKIPGAQISQNSGVPGGGGVSVRLRGVNSFIAGSDPLYIVDGVIIDNSSGQLADLGGRSNPQNRLADLNPADIERIEVIRGAAAAALYGSRANNGVVQIFTRRGTAGRPGYAFSTRVSRSHLREQQPFNFYPFDVAGLPIPRFNYQNDIFREANGTETNLAVDGGSETTRYYISASYADEEGILRSTDSKRVSGRVNVQQQLSSNLVGNITANLIQTSNQVQAFGEQNDYGVMGSLFFAPTSVDFTPVNGVYPLPPTLGTNPLLAIDRIRNPQQIDRAIGSIKLTWNPTSRILVDYTGGLDSYAFEQRQFIPRNSVLGTAPISTGRSQSTVQESRVLNQDAVAGYTWPSFGLFELRTTGGLQLHCAEGAHHAGVGDRARSGG
jgi:TonB-dependent starch-binding outer membrane protein SusC